MKPFDLAWQLLKANPSWMRRDANKGRIHTDDLPNPFNPNYQEQLIEEKQKRNAEDEAMERGNELIRQRIIAAYENRNKEASNNQTVGLDKIPTTQLYGQRPQLYDSFIDRLIDRQFEALMREREKPPEAMPTTLDTNYQRFYSNYS
tara:strand:+ start:145 stop:585 length:441 start_codon:yes stop_codon:yes gene_type:complete